MAGDLVDQNRERFVAHVTGGHLAQLIAFLLQRFAGGKCIPIASLGAIQVTIIAEGIAQKVQALPR